LACSFAALIVAQDKVKVVAVEMSKCPYCSAWKQNFQQGVLSKDGLRDIVDLSEWFIATDNGGGNYTCMHGEGECVGNTILLCAYNTTVEKSAWGWWDMGVCMQTQFSLIPDNAEGCATKVGLPWDVINTCATGKLGRDLFVASVATSRGLGVQSTPTIFIGTKEYVGGPNNPLALICNQYTGPKPAGCPQ